MFPTTGCGECYADEPSASNREVARASPHRMSADCDLSLFLPRDGARTLESSRDQTTDWGCVMRLVAGLCVLVLLAGCAGNGVTESPLTSDGPETVFSWGRDLSAWVSEDEMTTALRSLLGDVHESGAIVERSDDDWDWSFGGWTVSAHSGDHDGDRRRDTDLSKTDPRLPPGVVYEAAWGFAHGFYILSGPNSDESMCMTVRPQGRGLGYPNYPYPVEREIYPPESEIAAHEDRVFGLASMMLREMGWAG